MASFCSILRAKKTFLTWETAEVCDDSMAAKFDNYVTSYQRCLLLPSTEAKGEARLVEELGL